MSFGLAFWYIKRTSFAWDTTWKNAPLTIYKRLGSKDCHSDQAKWFRFAHRGNSWWIDGNGVCVFFFIKKDKEQFINIFKSLNIWKEGPRGCKWLEDWEKAEYKREDEKRVEFVKLKRQIPCLNGAKSQDHEKRLIWLNADHFDN